MSLGLLATPTVTICKVAKMVFNVAPGNFYLSQYLEYQEENGTSATVEALAGLAGGTDAAFVTTVLTNLGLADDAGASAFLTSAVAASGRGAALEAAIDALNNVASDNATYGAAKTAFDSAAVASVSYSTNTANNSTDVSTLAAAITPDAIASSNTVSLSLTTGVDNLTGSDGDDTFLGQQTGTATETTSAADQINGGAGNDTFTVTNTTASTAYVGPVLTGVENVVYRATAAGNLDAADLGDDATSLTLLRTGTTSDVTSLKLATALTVQDSTATMNSDVTYLASTVTGTADAGSVTVDGVSDGAELTFVGAIESFTVNTAGSDSRFDVLEVPATVTTYTINATGAGLRVDDTFTAANITSLTITGDSAVRIVPALGTSAATVDASAATGAITLTMGVDDQTITTGSGNDVLDMAGTLNKDDTIDLGEGDDTIRIDADGLSAGSYDLSISNVETARFDNMAGNSGAVQMDNLSIANIRIDGVNAAGQTATAGVLTLTDIAAANATFDFIGQGSDGAASDNVAFNGLTVDYDVSGTTDVSEVVINVNNGGVTGDDFFIQKIDLDNVDAISVVAADIGSAAADELTITEIESNDGAAGFTLTSNGEVIISDLDIALVESIDLSGVAAGGVTISDISSNGTTLTITGSAGNDTIVNGVNTNSNVVTVDLGAGSDTYTSLDATDTITTGAGSDTIILQGDANDDANIITDFTAGVGGDVIQFATSVASNGSTGTDMTLTAYGTANNGAYDEGIMIFSGSDAADLTTANVAARLADTDGAAGGAIISNDTETDELVYIVIDDGTDTGIFLLTNDTGTTAILAAELTLIGTLQGVDDATDLVAANFANFL